MCAGWFTYVSLKYGVCNSKGTWGLALLLETPLYGRPRADFIDVHEKNSEGKGSLSTV